MVLDRQGRILFISRGGIASLQITDPEAALGLLWLRNWPDPADRAAGSGAFDQALAGEVGRFEGFCPTHTGMPKWWDVVISPLPRPDGQVTRLVAVGRDITARKRAEQDRASELLRETERRLRLAQDAAGIGTFEIFVEDDAFAGSDQFFRLHGLLPCNRAPMALLNGLALPEDRVKLSTYGTRPGGPLVAPAEYRIRRADTGELRWIERQTDVRPDASGQLSHLIGIARDVTDQKTAAQRQIALVELGERLREVHSMAEIADAATAILGHTLNVARAGYGTVAAGSRVAVVDRDWCASPAITSIVGSHDLDTYGTFIDNLARGETVMVCDIGADAHTRPFAARLHDLQIKALLNVPLMDQGRLVALWFVHDTAMRRWTDLEVAFLQTVADRVWAAMERARALADLQRLNETLETQIVERTRERDQAWKNSPDLQLVLTQDGSFRAANAAWTSVLGWRPEDVVGGTYLDFIHPDDDLSSGNALLIVTTSPVAPHENRYRHRDGSYRWISWVAASEGGVIYASGRHITAEKQAAIAMGAVEERLRQAQKMEAVGQLTGGLAHDFNNLLTGITGSLELLQIRIAEGRFGDIDPYIDSAHNSARRAAALTHRLLAFSRQQTLEPKPINVNLLVAEMQGLLDMTVGSAIRTEIMGDPELWTTLVDPNQLENVLLNLVINARDAMIEGGHLTIRASNQQMEGDKARSCGLQPGPYVCLSVTDTGTGMTPETIARIFDPFYTTKPIGQGTGLGLSMIYGFAEQSGGRVNVRSSPGHGTTMSLYLPRDFSAEPAIELVVRRIPEGMQHGKILVVDDEETIRRLVVEVLQGLGHSVIEVDNAAAALQILRSAAEIDLLVTDVGLPGGMNGRQLAEIGRVIRADLKVVFMTGYAGNAMMGNAQLPPGMHVLSKPFRLSELTRRVNSLIAEDTAMAVEAAPVPG